jgi:polyribonucleotide nucleotidyltransferase
LDQPRQSQPGRGINPGGEIIRGIVDATGVKMYRGQGNYNDCSQRPIRFAQIYRKYIEMVQVFAAEAEIGKIYKGTWKIIDFGPFVEIFLDADGLVRISQSAKAFRGCRTF